MNAGGIYAIVNLIDDRRYVGSTSRIEERSYEHKWRLRRGDHHCADLQEAWDRDGAHAFAFEVIESVANPDDLIACEQIHIDAASHPYNTSLEAAAPMAGRRHSEAVRLKISAGLTGKRRAPRGPMSAERKAKISAALKGKNRGPKRDETIQKMQVAALRDGRRPPHTPESLARRAVALRGRKRPRWIADRTRQMWRDRREELCAKISATTKGLLKSDAHRAALSASHKGKASPHDRRQPKPCEECGTAMLVSRSQFSRKRFCSYRCLGLSNARRRWSRREADQGEST